MLNALATAFSIYSIVPVRVKDWTEQGLRYAICCFPAVGLFVGGMEYLTFVILEALHAGSLLRGCILAVVPVAMTGGIHLDGFMDTCDAAGSYKSREEKLVIMSDPHVGAFAVIGAVCYMIASAGIFSEMTPAALPLAVLVFVLSRALSGLAAGTFPKAKREGMLHSVTEGMPDRAVGILAVEAAAVSVLILIAAGVQGHFLAGIILLAASAVMYLIYYLFCLGTFGGTTGDLAGWFLQMTELVLLLVIALMHI